MLVINRDSFFLSHRLPLAATLQNMGHLVSIVAEDTGFGDEIRARGFKFFPLPIHRRGQNPLQELKTLWFLIRLYQREKPDLVHHVTPKPVFYGTLASRLHGNIPAVNAIVGLGSSLYLDGRRRSLQQRIVRMLYRVSLNHPRSRSIFMNQDHLDVFKDLQLLSREDSAAIIRGSGVDLEQFSETPEPAVPVVMFFSRLLRDKGIFEFIEACRALRSEFPQVRFVLVGDADSGNPSSVTAKELADWKYEGFELWGYRRDVSEVLSQASLVVLPSYGEGLPKALLEAMASGRAIVASNVPGCRECVKHEYNGLLVPPKDAKALKDAIARLLRDETLRKEMGHAGRVFVERDFGVKTVIASTLKLYNELFAQEATAS